MIYNIHSLQSNFDTKTIHSANLYQIFVYVKNLVAMRRDDAVVRMLLYARTDEWKPDQREDSEPGVSGY